MKRGIDDFKFSGSFPVETSVLLDKLGISNWVQKGDEIVHSCVLPFGLHSHGDRNPSGSYNEKKQVFHCWVCGGGSLLWWVSNVLECSRLEAVRLLRGSITKESQALYDKSFLDRIQDLWVEHQKTIVPLPVYSTSVIEKWVRPSRYLTDERQISLEVQEEMKTGIDLENVDEYKNRQIVQTRITIPVFFKGKLRGWVKRLVDREQAGSKYKNSYGFARERILYNYDRASEYSTVIVVESPLTVLRLLTLSVSNVVSTFGAKVSSEQEKLLRHWEAVDLWMDRDSPGQYSERRLIEHLQEFVFVRRVPHLYDKDIEDLDLLQLKECLEKVYL